MEPGGLLARPGSQALIPLSLALLTRPELHGTMKNSQARRRERVLCVMRCSSVLS